VYTLLQYKMKRGSINLDITKFSVKENNYYNKNKDIFKNFKNLYPDTQCKHCEYKDPNSQLVENIFTGFFGILSILGDIID